MTTKAMLELMVIKKAIQVLLEYKSKQFLSDVK
jgi:hypothetical protein